MLILNELALFPQYSLILNYPEMFWKTISFRKFYKFPRKTLLTGTLKLLVVRITLRLALFDFFHNLFVNNYSFPYPLKTSKKQRFSDDFKGYRNRALMRNELKNYANFEKIKRAKATCQLSGSYLRNNSVFSTRKSKAAY